MTTENTCCKEQLEEMPFTSKHLWDLDIHGLPIGNCLNCKMPIKDWRMRSTHQALTIYKRGIREKRLADTTPLQTS